jgi:hypothetical protein
MAAGDSAWGPAGRQVWGVLARQALASKLCCGAASLRASALIPGLSAIQFSVSEFVDAVVICARRESEKRATERGGDKAAAVSEELAPAEYVSLFHPCAEANLSHSRSRRSRRGRGKDLDVRTLISSCSNYSPVCMIATVCGSERDFLRTRTGKRTEHRL